jgi:hypothetical protein
VGSAVPQSAKKIEVFLLLFVHKKQCLLLLSLPPENTKSMIASDAIMLLRAGGAGRG